MPAADYNNPDPHTDEVMKSTVNRALRGSLVRMPNALESANRTEGTYFQGIAYGGRGRRRAAGRRCWSGND